MNLAYPPKAITWAYFRWARSVDPLLYLNPVWWQAIEVRQPLQAMHTGQSTHAYFRLPSLGSPSSTVGQHDRLDPVWRHRLRCICARLELGTHSRGERKVGLPTTDRILVTRPRLPRPFCRSSSRRLRSTR